MITLSSAACGHPAQLNLRGKERPRGVCSDIRRRCGTEAVFVLESEAWVEISLSKLAQISLLVHCPTIDEGLYFWCKEKFQWANFVVSQMLKVRPIVEFDIPTYSLHRVSRKRPTVRLLLCSRMYSFPKRMRLDPCRVSALMV